MGKQMYHRRSRKLLHHHRLNNSVAPDASISPPSPKKKAKTTNNYPKHSVFALSAMAAQSTHADQFCRNHHQFHSSFKEDIDDPSTAILATMRKETKLQKQTSSTAIATKRVHSKPPKESISSSSKKPLSSLCRIYGDQCYCEDCFDASQMLCVIADDNSDPKKDSDERYEDIFAKSDSGHNIDSNDYGYRPHFDLHSHQHWSTFYRASHPLCNYNGNEGNGFRLVDTCGLKGVQVDSVVANCRVQGRTYQRCYCEECTEWEDIAPDDDGGEGSDDDAWNTQREILFTSANPPEKSLWQDRSSPQPDHSKISDEISSLSFSSFSSSLSSQSSPMFSVVGGMFPRSLQKRDHIALTSAHDAPSVMTGEGRESQWSPFSPRHLFVREEDEECRDDA